MIHKSLLHLGRILVTFVTDMIEFNFECDVRNEIKKYKRRYFKKYFNELKKNVLFIFFVIGGFFLLFIFNEYKFHHSFIYFILLIRK